jgi:hypothetical protein
MDEIDIWGTHGSFDILMGIDELVGWSLQLYSLVWILDSTMFEELIYYGVVLLYAHKVFSEMLVSN